MQVWSRPEAWLALHPRVVDRHPPHALFVLLLLAGLLVLVHVDEGVLVARLLGQVELPEL